MASMASDPLSLFGAALVGFGIAALLTGVMCMQTYVYFKSERGAKDPLWLRSAVYVVWFLDVAQLFVQGAFIYDGLITNFGNYDWFPRMSDIFLVSPVMSAFIAVIVQMFYAWRVFRLSAQKHGDLHPYRKWFIPVCIACVSLVSFVTAIVSLSFCFTYELYADLRHVIVLIDVWLATSILVDVMIVGASYYYFSTARTGHGATNAMLDQLIRWTVETGLMPTLAELGHLITFTAWPGLFVHFAFNFVGGKLYANSLVAILNVRAHLQNDMSLSASQGIRIDKETTISMTGVRSTSFSRAPEPEFHAMEPMALKRYPSHESEGSAKFVVV